MRKPKYKIDVIYEDNHLIAVNKPAGWLTHGDKTKDKPLSEFVKDYIKDKYNKPGDVFLGVIHRIDRPVSGCVVFAKTSKALVRMNKLFHDKKIEKTYLAITNRCPSNLEGKLTHFLRKDTSKNVSYAYDNNSSNKAKGAKKSELTYKLLSRIAGHHLFEIKPLTGRPHQIRVQLSKINCPIHGDVKYGFTTPARDGNIYLHCKSLGFEHPVKKEPMLIKAKIPSDQIWQLF